jgi:hypothetical protein
MLLERGSKYSRGSLFQVQLSRFNELKAAPRIGLVSVGDYTLCRHTAI